MKLLLTTLNAKFIHLNLAIRLLYALNKDHKGLAWREFIIKENPEDIAKACTDYEVVAFSCYIWNITQTLAVARCLKALNPQIKILLGGPEVSYDWEEVIQKDEVDFIIVGEGEQPFRQFLAQYPNVQGIPNLVYKENKAVCFFPQTQVFDLANYETILPYQYDAPESLADKVAYIETSRGCPYKCGFCLASLDNNVRYLPDVHLKANLLYLMQHGQVIKFLDRTFNIKKKFTLDIFEFILAHHKPGNVFQFEITADILHPDIIKFIDEHVPEGLFRFEIGIQTVNQKANLAVSRKQNFDKTKSIIEAVRHKVALHLDLIVGLPLDEWADIRFSFEEVFKLNPPELQLGFLKFLKGTPVRYGHEQHGYIFDPNPPYQIIESKYLSKAELAQIELVEHALEIYWNKKRSTKTLRYVAEKYSSFDFFLGLGQYFQAEQAFHRYQIEDVFRVLWGFAQAQFPEDAVLHSLILLDYYTLPKLKPKPFFALDKIRVLSLHEIRQRGFDTQYRYVFLDLDCDYGHYVQYGEWLAAPSQVLLRYNGETQGEAILWEETILRA